MSTFKAYGAFNISNIMFYSIFDGDDFGVSRPF